MRATSPPEPDTCAMPAQTRRSVFVKVKPCPVRPDEVFLKPSWVTCDVARYFRWRERARLKIDE